MKTLIQSKVISIPATNGTNIYKSQFDSDKNYKHITGIACVEVSGDFTQNIEIEFKDDNGSLFSFSPAANWVKDSFAITKNLTEIFRKVNIISGGRNIYCNVKATNTASAVKFIVYYAQSNEEPTVKPYDFVCFDFSFAAVPGYKNIVLPTRYKNVVGIAATTSSNEAAKVFISVENSQTKLVDNIQLSAVKVTKETPYDIAFMPLDFAADGQELKLYATEAATVSNTVAGKVYFLLTD